MVGLVLSRTAGRSSTGCATWSPRSPATDVPVAVAGGTRGRPPRDERADGSRRRSAATLDAGADECARPARPRQRGAQPRGRPRGARPTPIAPASVSARRRSSRARSSPPSRRASARRSTRSPAAAERRRPWPSSREPDAMPERPTHRHRPGRPPCPTGRPVRPGREPVREPDHDPRTATAKPTPRASSRCSA